VLRGREREEKRGGLRARRKEKNTHPNKIIAFRVGARVHELGHVLISVLLIIVAAKHQIHRWA